MNKRVGRALVWWAATLAIVLGGGAVLAGDDAGAASGAARSEAAAVAGAPVRFGGETLVTLHERAVEFTAERRAATVAENIQRFADSDASIESLQVVREGSEFRIQAADEVLLVVTVADARLAARTQGDLAQDVVEKIAQQVAGYRSNRSLHSVLKGVAYTALSTLGLALAIWLIRKGFDTLIAKAAAIRNYLGPGVQIKGVQLLSTEQIEGAIRGALRVARIVTILLCLYFFVPLALSFFAVTRKLGERVFELFVTPIETLLGALAGYIPNFFFILVIILIAHYLLRFIHMIFALIARGDLKFEWFYAEWAFPTYQITRALVIVMAVISAFPYIPGSSSPAFQGIGLVLGLVVSFASSSAISNVIAGIILVYTRAFKVGDRVKVGDTLGDVVEKTLLVTRIRTPKNVVVTVPNSMVLNAHIINYSLAKQEGEAPLILHTTITIGYDVPWPRVQELLLAAAAATEGVEREPKPFVLQTALNDFYVSYELNVHTRWAQRMAVLYSDLHRNIQDAFRDAGVEIMSPHYQAWRDGNASTIPGSGASEGAAAGEVRLPGRLGLGDAIKGGQGA